MVFITESITELKCLILKHLIARMGCSSIVVRLQKRVKRGYMKGKKNNSATNLYRNLYRDPNYRELVKSTNRAAPSHLLNLVGIYVGSLKLFMGWMLLTVLKSI